MKKCILFYIILCCSALHAFAQSSYPAITEKFLNFYNRETPDSIFNLYAPPLQEKLPLEKTRSLFSGLHVEFGDLRSLDLLKQDSGFNRYKATFNHQTLVLLLSLNTDNQIEGFRLVPYYAEEFPEQKK